MRTSTFSHNRCTTQLKQVSKSNISLPGCLQHDVMPGMVIGVFTHDRRIKNVNYKSTLVSVCIQKKL